MNLRDAPIREKLTVAIMLTSTVVLCLTAAVFIVHEVSAFHRTLAGYSGTIARITAAEGSGAVDYENEADCRKILSKLNSEPSILLAAFYGRLDKLLARYPESADPRSFPATPLTNEYRIENGAVNIFTPVRQDNRIVGSLYLKWDLSDAYRQARWDAGILGLVLIGSLAVGRVISAVLQRRISGPILELADTARAVAVNRDYSVRAKKHGSDELGLLTDAFNQMLARIQTQDGSLRKGEEQLRRALQTAETVAEKVCILNVALEDRVASRTAELAAANLELEAFTYSVSHDLRAPIRHIDAYAQILEEEKDPAAFRQYLSRIRVGVQDMGRLVDDLLKLSRVGRAQPKPAMVQLHTIVEEVLAELKLELANRDIEWRIAALPSATVDPGLIKQLFANLLSNAVKFTRPRDHAVIEIGTEPGDEGVAIFIRDNGVGFDMKCVDKLFRVFQRLHRAEEFEGSGIGLHTVQRIVRLHGGEIRAEAELDKGATFHFTLRGLEARRDDEGGASVTKAQ
ncbi:MAG: ATP-binding protein [Verrucomicrobiota bacterium]|jgi:signal transduction histidine kinase